MMLKDESAVATIKAEPAPAAAACAVRLTSFREPVQHVRVR